MRIVNLETFLSLPEGVVYAEYEPCIFGDLTVKYDSYGGCNATVAALTFDVESEGGTSMFDILDAAVKDSNYSVPLTLDGTRRDSFYNVNQLFAVYEQKDIDQLINKLKECRGI